MTDKERQTYTREVQIKKQRHSTASVHPPMFPTNIKKFKFNSRSPILPSPLPLDMLPSNTPTRISANSLIGIGSHPTPPMLLRSCLFLIKGGPLPPAPNTTTISSSLNTHIYLSQDIHLLRPRIFHTPSHFYFSRSSTLTQFNHPLHI